MVADPQQAEHDVVGRDRAAVGELRVPQRQSDRLAVVGDFPDFGKPGLQLAVRIAAQQACIELAEGLDIAGGRRSRGSNVVVGYPEAIRMMSSAAAWPADTSSAAASNADPSLLRNLIIDSSLRSADVTALSHCAGLCWIYHSIVNPCYISHMPTDALPRGAT